jgi:hypothetical protein
MQELINSIKRQNPRIMGVKEGEEVQDKGYIIYSKNNSRKFPKSQERVVYSYGKPPGHQTDLTKIEPLCSILALNKQAQKPEKEY